MKKMSYLSLLIFCGVLTQGISDLLDENIDESTIVHIRQKRVIRLDKDGRDDGRPVSLENVPYIVDIQKNNITACPGTILSAVFILVLRSCISSTSSVPPTFPNYRILTRSVSGNRTAAHTIRRKIRVEPAKQLALIEASPPFNFEESPNRPITLFFGALPPPPRVAYGIFTGWGCTNPGSSLFHQRVFPGQLMQVRLPIIPLEQCLHIYHNSLEIVTEQNMCTLDETKRRGTCYGDEGGPLAVQFPPLEQHQLIGILLFKGKKLGKHPDVFVDLNREVVNQWITQTIQNHLIH